MYLIKTKDNLPLDIVDESNIEGTPSFNQIVNESEIGGSINTDNIEVARIDNQKLTEYVNEANKSLAKIDMLVKTYNNFLKKAENYTENN